MTNRDLDHTVPENQQIKVALTDHWPVETGATGHEA
jgi:hypothetical protein